MALPPPIPTPNMHLMSELALRDWLMQRLAAPDMKLGTTQAAKSYSGCGFVIRADQDPGMVELFMRQTVNNITATLHYHQLFLNELTVTKTARDDGGHYYSVAFTNVRE